MESQLAALELSKPTHGPPPTDSVPSLPEDVLYIILEMAAAAACSPPISYKAGAGMRGRYRFLRDAALTARAWRAPAQSLLWADVQLEDPDKLQKFMECSGLGRRTRVLRLSGQGGIAAWPSLEGELCGAVGLEKLVLVKVSLARMEQMLCLPSLRDIMSLHLEHSTAWSVGAPNISLHFSLRHLRLQNWSTAVKSHRPLLLALFAATTSLSLDISRDATNSGFSLFPSTLTSLQLVDWGVAAHQRIPLWTTLEQALSTSTSIQHLSLPRLRHERNFPTAVPYPLETLTLTERLDAESIAVLVQGLRGTVALSALRELRLAVRIVAGPRREAFEEIMEECERRGTEVVFAQ